MSINKSNDHACRRLWTCFDDFVAYEEVFWRRLLRIFAECFFFFVTSQSIDRPSGFVEDISTLSVIKSLRCTFSVIALYRPAYFYASLCISVLYVN